MKKFYLTIWIAVLALLPFMMSAQNIMVNGDLESWDDANNPTGWTKSENISQEATEIHGGTYAAAHESASGTQDFQQEVTGVVGGQQYTISYFYKDNDPMARTRIWSYWLEGENTLPDNEDVLRPGDYSEDNGDWMEFNETLTAPAGADGFRFEVRVYRQDDQTGGHVYYDDFSFVGDQNVYPEPTNYPTEFTSIPAGVTITLDWMDATGEQLPVAYLIQAEEMPLPNDVNFDVPQDGTPVADDLDFSDGKAAVNVLFGAETYTFTGLEPGMGYQFIIHPYTNAGANIDYKTDGEAPTTESVTENIIILNQEGFDDGLGTWMEYNVIGEQNWYQDEFGGQTFAKMSGYAGQSNENEDWLISPQMDWTDYNELYFKFISAMNYDGPALQLFVSENYDGSGNPNDFDWMDVSADYAWSDGGWNWVESGNGDLTLFDWSTAYLAFKYTSTVSESSTWELDDLMVYGMKTSGIGDVAENTFKLYPNPASDVVNIALEEDGKVQIVNLNGQVVYESELANGQHRISVGNFTKGFYMIRFQAVNGNATTQKLIIE